MKIKYLQDEYILNDLITDVPPESTGFMRQKKGNGFIYLTESGEEIRDEEILSRIHNLRIPPAWKNVWICKEKSGYIQATGVDAKNRKQYIYHAGWKKISQQQKFGDLEKFVKLLPLIRRQVEKDLRKKGWPKEKVIALIIKILDETYVRIGNELYKNENETFGLTTLRKKHLKDDKNEIHFDYKGKSGKYRRVNISNKRLAKLIRNCAEQPGYEIFRYRENGKYYPVDSHEVNEYLYSITGKHFTSKSFRTWGGTVLAVKKIEEARDEIKKNKRKNLETTVVKKIANELGNTISVCRTYYIHPFVLNQVIKEDFIPQLPEKNLFTEEDLKYVENEELIVAHILNMKNTLKP